MVKSAAELVKWQGYLYPGELELLQNLAAEIPADGVVVQIGAGAGTASIGILEVTEEVVIFSVDIHCGEVPALTNEHLRLPEVGFGDTGHVIRVWGDSKLVGKRWPISIDLLFVDGDHGAEGVTADIQEWVRHVRAGGLIFFHDYGSNHWPAVKEAVDNLVMDKHEMIGMADTLIAFRKGEA